jgi:hypothetical protein
VADYRVRVSNLDFSRTLFVNLAVPRGRAGRGVRWFDPATQQSSNLTLMETECMGLQMAFHGKSTINNRSRPYVRTVEIGVHGS